MTDNNISTTRRHALATAAALAAATVLPTARAQAAWPNRPLKIVVGFPGGSRPTSRRACWPSRCHRPWASRW
jgi:hypothetical protein